MGDSARNLLAHTTLKSIKDEQKIAILKDVATVEQALKVLKEYKVVSAPVVVTPDDDTSEGPLHATSMSADILGFVDIKDILESFLTVIESDLPALNEQKNLLQRMRMLEDKGAEFGELKIKDLKFIGTDGDFIHSSQASSTLYDLVVNGLLQPRDAGGSDRAHVVHRIALFDNSGRITHIISQSDIIKFLHKSPAKLGSLGSATVGELGLISGHVEGVHPETPAIEALMTMSKLRLSSLAVLDPNGAIVGNFSLSDLRTIVSAHFGALALPVGEFLAHEHRTEYVGFNRLHEEGVEGTAGHRFVMDHISRQRPRTPGAEVGQSLVLATRSSTLTEVRRGGWHTGWLAL